MLGSPVLQLEDMRREDIDLTGSQNWGLQWGTDILGGAALGGQMEQGLCVQVSSKDLLRREENGEWPGGQER